jgi:hypothetical protein
MMTRQEFLRLLVKAGATTAGVAVAMACSSSDSSSVDAAPDGAGSSSAGNCLANGTSVTIATNHGHVLVVSKADVAAGADKTYHIMGTALHDHTVSVTAAQFATLAANSGIAVTSSTDDSHNHHISIMCA